MYPSEDVKTTLSIKNKKDYIIKMINKEIFDTIWIISQKSDLVEKFNNISQNTSDEIIESNESKEGENMKQEVEIETETEFDENKKESNQLSSTNKKDKEIINDFAANSELFEDTKLANSKPFHSFLYYAVVTNIKGMECRCDCNKKCGKIKIGYITASSSVFPSYQKSRVKLMCPDAIFHWFVFLSLFLSFI